MIASRLRNVRKWLGAAVVATALTVGSVVLAQSGGSGDPTPPGDPAADPATGQPPTTTQQPAGTPPTATPPAGATASPGTTQVRVQIGPGEMVQAADGYLKEMRKGMTRVVQAQEVARKQKDIIKINCVNDKLLQVKQLLNIGESAKTNLEESIARGDEDARYDWFSTLTIASEQVAQLVTEAENCIGEDLSYLGPSDITVEGGDEPDDPTLPPDPTLPEVDLPPVASPFI
jgi:hypothetical protein